MVRLAPVKRRFGIPEPSSAVDMCGADILKSSSGTEAVHSAFETLLALSAGRD